ncbi:MAG: hypothetical protein NC548_60135 [Lachnospiraceae bacterium]|nr:hypothetical protein [Lachnospiraceae bacterium]
MKTYFLFLRKKFYIGFCIILSCAFLGALRGAWKENGEGYIGITQDDLAVMQQNDGNAPELTGIIGLAAEQERWRNFDYAWIYALRGMVIYCVLMAVYLPMYRLRFFKALRTFLKKDDMENDLFIHAGEDD